MKFSKIILLLAAITMIGGRLSAQITFFEGSFDEAAAKAKAEKKDLFVDFYTNWCAPCKLLAKEVFTLPEVGEYFNKHFVSIQLNAEAAEHKALVERYKIDAFPYLLFLTPQGEVIRTVRGAASPAYLMQEARIATGDMLTFEKLYEKCKKEKRNMEARQELLLRAPEFMATQTGYNQEKWVIRIEAAFDDYLAAKKLENMITPSDFAILTLYHTEMKKTDEIFDFVVKHYDEFTQVVDKERVQNYLIGLYNVYLIGLCRDGKQEYKKELERVNGDLKAVYADIPFGKLSAYEAISLLADGYYSLFAKDLPHFFETMEKYFTGAVDVLTLNDYTQPIEDLFALYQGKLPEIALPQTTAWINRALAFDMQAQLRTRLLMMLGECLYQSNDIQKAKQSYNQAFLVSAEIEEAQLKAYLQNAIKERLNSL